MRFRSLSLIVTTAFLGGAAASQLLVREARAQTAPFASTIYVPADGLAFRRFDGHVIARLSYDSHGGVFEVYDEREQVADRVRTEALGRAPAGATNPGSAGAAPAKPNPALENPFVDVGF